MPLTYFDNERIVEVSWLLSRLGQPRRLLDVGHADAEYAPELIASGAAVTLQDVRPFYPRHVPTPLPPNVTLYTWAVPWPVVWTGLFDLVTCISVLDHVGLDAYGQAEDAEALPALIAELRRVIAPGGRLLLTVPVGRDLWTTHPGGGQRVFSARALWDLFDGWTFDSLDLYRYVDGRYVPRDAWRQVADAGYLGDRAEAVACLEVRP